MLPADWSTAAWLAGLARPGRISAHRQSGKWSHLDGERARCRCRGLARYRGWRLRPWRARAANSRRTVCGRDLSRRATCSRFNTMIVRCFWHAGATCCWRCWTMTRSPTIRELAEYRRAGRGLDSARRAGFRRLSTRSCFPSRGRKTGLSRVDGASARSLRRRRRAAPQQPVRSAAVVTGYRPGRSTCCRAITRPGMSCWWPRYGRISTISSRQLRRSAGRPDLGRNQHGRDSPSPESQPSAGGRLSSTCRRIPLNGDLDMPKAQGPAFGASERFSVSPGDEANGILHMPTGQSGHPLSPYYSKGHDDWVRGLPSPFLPGPAEHRLTLTPAGG